MERAIFIAGANHSGTTLLGCALGSSCDPHRYFHVGECYSYFTPHSRFYASEKVPSRFGSIWGRIDARRGPGGAYDEVERASAPDAIIDSSKIMAWYREQEAYCVRRGIPWHVVVCYRPFRALFHSSRKRGQSLDKCEKVLRYYWGLRVFLESRQPASVHFVSIRDLCERPAETLSALCESLGLTYFSGKENYWNFTHHHIAGANLQREHIKNPQIACYRTPSATALPKEDEAYFVERGFDDLERDVLDYFRAAQFA